MANRMHNRSLALLLLLAVGWVPAGASSSSLTEPAPDVPPAAEKLVHDYIALYAHPTLEEWKTLFHPSLSVAHVTDGAIRVRNLDEFFNAQKKYFESGRAISERLENVRIEPGRRIARVTAGFVFVDEGEEHHGTLGLHLAQGEQGWKIVAILFSYDEPR